MFRPKDWERRPFGAHMDVAAMVAAQTRIERQDTPHAASASFDFATANAFQSYVSSAIVFSIKRGGIMYGTGAWGCWRRGRGGGGRRGVRLGGRAGVAVKVVVRALRGRVGEYWTGSKLPI